MQHAGRSGSGKVPVLAISFRGFSRAGPALIKDIAMSQSSADKKLHPPPARLVEIADAADGLAGALRNDWFLQDATPEQNPGKSMFPSNAQTGEARQRIAAKVIRLTEAMKKLRALVETLLPGDFFEESPDGLKDIRDAAVFRPDEPAILSMLEHPGISVRKPTARPVVGWGLEVQERVMDLQDVVGTIVPDVPISVTIADRLETAAEILREAAGTTEDDPAGKKKSKRRKTRRKAADRPITGLQRDAVEIVGKCDGNFAEAGRQMGLDRSTVRQHYHAGMAKLQKVGVKQPSKRTPKPSTGKLPTDRRDQANIADGDDQRL